MVVYSLLRLGLLAVALVALWAVGLGGWLLVVVAAVVAWALSYVLLTGPRDRAALWVAERARARRSGPRFTPGVESDAAAEDAEADAPAPAPQGEGVAPADYPAQDEASAQSERPSPSSTP